MTNFERLWSLWCGHDDTGTPNRTRWADFDVSALLVRDVQIRVWSGQSFALRTCAAGTRVRLTMVSRLGDVGISADPLSKSYDARVDPDSDLTDITGNF